MLFNKVGSAQGKDFDIAKDIHPGAMTFRQNVYTVEGILWSNVQSLPHIV